jgi:hypothetical protein
VSAPKRTRELRCTVGRGADGQLVIRGELVEEGGTVVLADPEPLVMGPASEPDLALDGAGAITIWGHRMGHLLATAVGRDVMGELLREPDELRIVFSAPDAVARQLPFESAAWPPGEDDAPTIGSSGVSILRVPDIVRSAIPPSLHAREPGLFKTFTVTASTPGGDFSLGDFIRNVPALSAADARHGTEDVEAPDTFGWMWMPFGTAGVPSDLRDLRRVIQDAGPDLAVLVGHGERDRGWVVGRDRSVRASELGHYLGPYASAFLLVMCASARSTEVSESAALALARSGAAIAIGFQGDRTAVSAAVPFTNAFLGSLRTSLAAASKGTDPIGLEDWEAAIAAGRSTMGDSQVLPVAYIHPNLLKYRAETPSVGRVLRRAAASPKLRMASAVPWYVPGQVVCWEDDTHGTLRVPLPVDVGALLTIEVVDGRGASTCHGPVALGASGVDEVLGAWAPRRDWRLEVRLDPPCPPDPWAAKSAELSALVRALAWLLKETPPPYAVALLDEAVRDEWGAHDAAPRAVSTETGRRIYRFAGWPDIGVDPRNAGRDPRIPDPVPLVSADPRALLETALDGLAGLRFLELIRLQLEAVRGHRDTKGGKPFAEAVRKADVIAFPGAGRVAPEGAFRPSRGAWRTDVPDELR